MTTTKVYQCQIDYFFSTGSGYGTVKTLYGNIFSNIDFCINNSKILLSKYDVNSWQILEYKLNSDEPPVLIVNFNCKF
jgi:hypothetical protein